MDIESWLDHLSSQVFLAKASQAVFGDFQTKMSIMVLINKYVVNNFFRLN